MIIEKNLASYLQDYVGKIVYFMMNDRIMEGRVSGVDNYQLFVEKQYGIHHGNIFFFNREELVDYLRSNVRSAKAGE